MYSLHSYLSILTTQLCAIFCLCSLVVETLKDMDPSRKCFRMVSGVLVERTVGEVLPALRSNRDKVISLSIYYQGGFPFEFTQAIIQSDRIVL